MLNKLHRKNILRYQEGNHMPYIRRKTDNAMAKRKTDNTMSKRKTDNTMAKRKTDNAMARRKTDNTMAIVLISLVLVTVE
jgi:hypothetical protein